MKQGLGKLFLQRLWDTFTLCQSSWKANLSLAVLFTIVTGSTLVVSYTGNIIGGFYTAIIAHDLAEFYRVLWQGLLVVIGSGLLDAGQKFLTQLLAYIWRKQLGASLQSHYFSQCNYYHLGFGRVDNADQRITQDLENFCTSLGQVLAGCISAPLIIGLYSVLCYSKVGWVGPAAIYAYFFVGMLGSKLIMSPMVQLVVAQEQLEGAYRFGHAQVRTFAESIAIYSADRAELETANRRFARLLANQFSLAKWTLGLNAIANLLTYTGSILNYSVVALSVFWLGRTADAGSVAEATFQCIMLISGFSQFLNVSSQLTSLAGYLQRISELFEAQPQDIEINLAEQICFRNVSLFTPQGRLLVANLNLVIEQGRSLVIQGCSGVGKSTLVRALCGIWPHFQGSISKPQQSPKLIYFLPQQAYFPTGSLEQQISYPDSDPISEQQQRDCFRLAQLDWQRSTTEPNSLSRGEQQRLALTRVFYHRPRFVVLDEATNAIDQAREQAIYAELIKLGITIISISHQQNFVADQLTLYEDGSWTYQKA